MGLIAQLLPKIGFKHFTAAYRGSPPPAVFHNQIKKTQQGNLLGLSLNMQYSIFAFSPQCFRSNTDFFSFNETSLLRVVTSAGTLLWIYRTHSAGSIYRQYIGSTWKTQILIILVFVAVLHLHLQHIHIAIAVK